MTQRIYVDYPGVESLNYYCAEGYLSSSLPDTSNRCQYVEYKPGQGSYATVCDCADASKYSTGTKLEVLSRSTAGAGRGKPYILEFIDSFTHEGPNGSHLCVVTEASGPNLTEDAYDVWEDEAIPPSLKVSNTCTLATLSMEIQLIADDPSQSHTKLCDLGESSFHEPASTGAQRKLNYPRVYAAFEVIFDELVRPALDVWAMGNLLHSLLSGGQELGTSVISGRPNPTDDEVLKIIVLVLGKLPDPRWQRWEERRKYFDEEARPAEGVSRVSRLARIPNAYIKEEESEEFEKVVWGVFYYNSRTRLTSREVANRLEWLAS
ncbi:hypothetical protein K443DRAFT_7858 [Laccaria amethystina LaAM-08-1]|uniref:non-specific serine/threonine protein kinase n=1 Tax=Laccaria amethystina LaAM-08-1 TaxID=1095629 RepID=A0A0C9XW93_9AGAR|nr:hypothetical protein K443DRAFT_7858 [Laccaria amethystina LaAM-08-1]